MTRERLCAFSDGVIAILITIMVLELKIPDGDDWGDLREMAPIMLAYVLSFVFVGIFWNNHHHLLQTVDRVTGGILWANLHLLFWLSLVPFVTAWLGQHGSASPPATFYGIVVLFAGIAYYTLQRVIVASQGEGSLLGRALQRDVKGRISPVLCLLAIILSFVHAFLAEAIYIFVALMWLVPDRRIERVHTEQNGL